MHHLNRQELLLLHKGYQVGDDIQLALRAEQRGVSGMPAARVSPQRGGAKGTVAAEATASSARAPVHELRHGAAAN